MSLPTPLELAVDRRLYKWRRSNKGDNDPRFPNWHGISAIANGLGSKVDVRAALATLVEKGRVERGDFSNGIYYRGAERDIINLS